MAEGKMHLAPVMAIDPGDRTIIDNLVVEVVSTPHKEIKGGIARAVGRAFGHAASGRAMTLAAVSTEQMIPSSMTISTSKDTTSMPGRHCLGTSGRTFLPSSWARRERSAAPTPSGACRWGGRQRVLRTPVWAVRD